MEIKAPTTVAEYKDLCLRWENAGWYLDQCEREEQYEACSVHMTQIEKVLESVFDNFIFDEEHGEPIGVKE